MSCGSFAHFQVLSKFCSSVSASDKLNSVTEFVSSCYWPAMFSLIFPSPSTYLVFDKYKLPFLVWMTLNSNQKCPNKNLTSVIVTEITVVNYSCHCHSFLVGFD